MNPSGSGPVTTLANLNPGGLGTNTPLSNTGLSGLGDMFAVNWDSPEVIGNRDAGTGIEKDQKMADARNRLM